MTFIKATAADGQRTDEVLSADNVVPERHIVIETIRNAAPRLGLSPTVITTLDAMLSCLAPKRNHHTVFASNSTLTFRRNGISDRTLRRHAAILEDAGLLQRNDSPNKKRFTRHSKMEGKTLRFGFDLSPLFSRLFEISALAAEVIEEKAQIKYQRTKLRAIANNRINVDPEDHLALAIFKKLRRKLSLQNCEEMLMSLQETTLAAETVDGSYTSDTTQMADNDGRNVRHHHRSNKEDIDRNPPSSSPDAEVDISVSQLKTACPAAMEFALNKIETSHDVVAHARTLAPMLGINNQSYNAAVEHLGQLRAAATVWAIMQFHEKIKAVGAYFHSITIGKKSSGFSPEKLIKRLVAAQNCPRTI
ncbi:plasmid replication protein RepC [Sulfitobacter sp. F26169L]|uniref:plasmid replication protein RepC n=1 Tax=Sulfitobacter sp. F26169L TaxID=2996015 RepID=UPI002260DC0D|nr:plasmid replication protein RepC [Sulfitobacter sp. F26169L]MCX7567881.1 plasmid replication protein RepC [Sulfitobacter sp. F26169L]